MQTLVVKSNDTCMRNVGWDGKLHRNEPFVVLRLRYEDYTDMYLGNMGWNHGRRKGVGNQACASSLDF
jgi:hypothetical protein